MSTEIAVFEKQLTALTPHFTDVLGTSMPAARLIRTVVISVERLPKLLECTKQSLFNAAMSAAVLGLEVDGVTGQAFLIPFKGKAQLVIGYKGYATIAARAGFTITGAVVREGDVFEYELGSTAFVRHVPALGNKGRILAAWAAATHSHQPPVVSVLGIDDLLAVKNKSPGASRSDSPWNDPAIGFPAMCEKTAKRRLARSMPLNMMQSAARMDEAVDEQGKATWISPERGVVIEGEIMEPSETPMAHELTSPRKQETTHAVAPAGATSDPASAGDTSDIIVQLDKGLADAAEQGTDALRAEVKSIHPRYEPTLRAAIERHKRRAAEVDQRVASPS